jgi:hypothetical protein
MKGGLITMPIWVQWVSLALAVVGSITGIYALILNHQRTTIIKRKEKERLEAKKKAKLIIQQTSDMSEKKIRRNFIVIRNDGQADARNVSLQFYKVNDQSGKRQRIVPLLGEIIPSRIAETQELKVQYFYTKDKVPLPWELEITWDDDFNSGNKIETTIN